MSDRRTINGTPWHVGFISKEEEDSRRHRARCIYFIKENKMCKVQNFKCIGAAHCNAYKEHEESAASEKKKETPEYIKKALAQLEKEKAKREQPDNNTNNSKKKKHPNKQKNVKVVSSTNKNEKQAIYKKLPQYAYKGALIHHKAYGNGLVYDVKDGYISIIFNSGQDVDFNIDILEKINVLSLRNKEENLNNNDLDNFMMPPTI